MKNIVKIVLTGGPCAGKTTMLEKIKKHFTENGVRVLVVSETATDLLFGGISPFNMDNIMFQYIVTKTMQFKESMMMLAAQTVPEENVLIVCDRGQMDNTAYMTDSQLCELMKKLDTNTVQMRDAYDAVFHLETAAKYSESEYDRNSVTNSERYEKACEAIELDNKIINAWVGHMHFRLIPAFSDFNKKGERLISGIESVIGKNAHLEIERKFLIKRPPKSVLQALPFCRKIDIEQCYINDGNRKFRVRKRGEGGNYIYRLTEKKKISDITQEEYEHSISESEYETYSANCEAKLEKTRYCIVYDTKYFELDVYPYSNEHALIEIEMLSEDETFNLPDFVDVIEEVTHKKQYRNSAIARLHTL